MLSLEIPAVKNFVQMKEKHSQHGAFLGIWTNFSQQLFYRTPVTVSINNIKWQRFSFGICKVLQSVNINKFSLRIFKQFYKKFTGFP